MHCQEFSRVRIELDFLVLPDVDFCEITLVEVGLQYLSVYKNLLFFQFFLCSEDKPSCIQLSVLAVDNISLLAAFRF